jgi:hypothetical protein
MINTAYKLDDSMNSALRVQSNSTPGPMHETYNRDIP